MAMSLGDTGEADGDVLGVADREELGEAFGVPVGPQSGNAVLS